jgi:hypothetical protein
MRESLSLYPSTGKPLALAYRKLMESNLQIDSIAREGTGMQANRRRRRDVQRLLPARLRDAHELAGAGHQLWAYPLPFMPHGPGTGPWELGLLN